MSVENSDFGVCRLSLVPVRSEGSDKAELTTQLLFGEHYEVLSASKDKKWLKIKMQFDQYEGWIDAKQHHSISKDHFEYINRADFKISTDVTTSILYNKTPLSILMGSIIPISGSELFKMEEQFAFNGESKSLGQKRDAEFLKITAKKYLNAPYLWGGKSPFGIDCSGFVQMVFKINGYKLQRDSAQQAKQGKNVSFQDMLPGDLMFFKNKENQIVHVGIFMGDEKIIHASGKVRIDHVNEEGILHMESRVYTHSFSLARRILSE
ncbi:MAG TPA: C40 family peptidase [Cyclobacteriaceae bacterium]|nr:C40 family peptidase [Cyclobacteriaceae bacterium]HMV09460.1 C40 family peptidase [Cyclobacteriaceae bacterium]HMV89453.1 C40 family peptidase [Cyclobacteriaceae bacterium]HMX02481.1 C40 family peptidase [Cyclobacteriaceae bacterium]HMX52089.1 C40 family peptidase [Cyclobacteriaceae bacterium]